MDAFYASFEERENPALAGKPLIVGGTPEGRGVVAAANYVVRQFGVHSAMPTATALRLCPQAIVIRPRREFYAEVSRQIQDVFLQYTPLVEPLSLDEAFLDVTGSVSLFGSGSTIARHLKGQIKSETGLVASFGVAQNKFLAKMPSDLDKPDGLVMVDPHRLREFPIRCRSDGCGGSARSPAACWISWACGSSAICAVSVRMPCIAISAGQGTTSGSWHHFLRVNDHAVVHKPHRHPPAVTAVSGNPCHRTIPPRASAAYADQ